MFGLIKDIISIPVSIVKDTLTTAEILLLLKDPDLPEETIKALEKLLDR